MKQFKSIAVALVAAGMLCGSVSAVRIGDFVRQELGDDITNNQIKEALRGTFWANFNLNREASDKLKEHLVSYFTAPIESDNEDSSEGERPVFRSRGQYGPTNRPSNYTDQSDDLELSDDDTPGPIQRCANRPMTLSEKVTLYGLGSLAAGYVLGDFVTGQLASYLCGAGCGGFYRTALLALKGSGYVLPLVYGLYKISQPDNTINGISVTDADSDDDTYIYSGSDTDSDTEF